MHNLQLLYDGKLRRFKFNNSLSLCFERYKCDIVHYMHGDLNNLFISDYWHFPVLVQTSIKEAWWGSLVHLYMKLGASVHGIYRHSTWDNMG